MAALDFPGSPSVGQTYTANGKSWVWDGQAWNGSAAYFVPTGTGFYHITSGSPDPVAAIGSKEGFFDGHFVTSYGVVTGGTVDQSTAINAAIADAIAATNGHVVLNFPAGIFYISHSLLADLTGSKSVHLKGMPGKIELSGTTANSSGTVIRCDFAAAVQVGLNLFTTATTAPNKTCKFIVEDINFVFTGAATDSVGVQVGTVSTNLLDGNDINCELRNVNCANFPLYGFWMVNSRCITLNNCTATVPGGAAATASALVFQAALGQFCGDANINSCTFVGSGTAAQRTVYLIGGAAGSALRGLHFTDCVIYNGAQGAYILANNGGVVEDIFFVDCAWDGTDGVATVLNAVKIQTGGTGGTVSGITFSGSYMVNWNDYGVYFSGVAGGIIKNIIFDGTYIGLCDSGAFFAGDFPVDGLHITNSTMFDIGNGSTGVGGAACITLNNGVTKAVIANNTHTNSAAQTCAYLVTIPNVPAAGNNFMSIVGNIGKCNQSALNITSTGANIYQAGNWQA